MNRIELDQLPTRATWVFTGDSVTQGVHHTHGSRSWVELVSERIRWELDRLQDIVINAGVSGWTAPEVAAEYEHLIGRFAPDVLSVSLGTNDALGGEEGLAVFRRRLTEVVHRGADSGALLVLHTPVLAMHDAPPARRQWLPAVADAIRDVAADEGTALVDHEKHWCEQFGSEGPTPWMDDHTHPNSVGHQQMAGTTLRALGLGELIGRP